VAVPRIIGVPKIAPGRSTASGELCWAKTELPQRVIAPPRKTETGAQTLTDFFCETDPMKREYPRMQIHLLKYI
jgi:hypothetical protein